MKEKNLVGKNIFYILGYSSKNIYISPPRPINSLSF